MIRRNFIRASAAILVLFAVPGLGFAQAPSSDAERYVAAVLEDGLKKLSAKEISNQERRRTLISLLNQYVDIPLVEQSIVGRYWERSTPEQRTEYRRLLLDYLSLSYADSLKDFDKTVKLEYLGTEKNAAGITTVHGQMLPPGEPVVLFDVNLLQRPNGEFKIVDATLAGVNIVEMWRSDFTSIIRSAGGKFEALNEALAKKIGNINPSAN
jgi:phospholipid transport system substrate-binding protein